MSSVLMLNYISEGLMISEDSRERKSLCFVLNVERSWKKIPNIV